MAGTAVNRRNTSPPESDVAQLAATVNRLVDDLELVRSKLVAHAAVAHAAVAGCDAANLTGYKVNLT